METSNHNSLNGKAVVLDRELNEIAIAVADTTTEFKTSTAPVVIPDAEVEDKEATLPPFMGRVDSISPASGAQFALLPPDNATGNFTKIVQRVPVKIVLDPQSIKGYESRIVPGMSAEASVELK